MTATETVHLHDGPAQQHVAPGLDPVSHSVRQIAQEHARRTARRGDAPPPSGGLWDETAQRQMDLF